MFCTNSINIRIYLCPSWSRVKWMRRKKHTILLASVNWRKRLTKMSEDKYRLWCIKGWNGTVEKEQVRTPVPCVNLANTKWTTETSTECSIWTNVVIHPAGTTDSSDVWGGFTKFWLKFHEGDLWEYFCISWSIQEKVKYWEKRRTNIFKNTFRIIFWKDVSPSCPFLTVKIYFSLP